MLLRVRLFELCIYFSLLQLTYTGMVAYKLKKNAHAEFEPKEEMCSVVHYEHFHLHVLERKHNNAC